MSEPTDSPPTIVLNRALVAAALRGDVAELWYSADGVPWTRICFDDAIPSDDRIAAVQPEGSDVVHVTVGRPAGQRNRISSDPSG